MGLINNLLGLFFTGERNVIKETAEVFRVNAEADASRGVDLRGIATDQFASEFGQERKTWFDSLIDGLNRIPRPAMALGTLGLIVSAMIDPVWFASRMQGLALVPEPLWWLLGAIVSFYFGGRWQAKSQDFQASIAATVARTPQVVENIKALRALNALTPGTADTGQDAKLQVAALRQDDNPALADWRLATA